MLRKTIKITLIILAILTASLLYSFRYIFYDFPNKCLSVQEGDSLEKYESKFTQASNLSFSEKQREDSVIEKIIQDSDNPSWKCTTYFKEGVVIKNYGEFE